MSGKYTHEAYLNRDNPGATLPGQEIQRRSPCPAPEPREPPSNLERRPGSMMIRPYSLSCLLLLPLGACFPRVDRKEPVDTTGGIGAEMSWADLAKGHPPNFLWGSSRWLRAPHSHTLLMPAKELQMSGKEPASFRLRFGRQDDSSEATSFFTVDGEKASGPLGMLAEELNGYSRKKGGFNFRFGRR